MAIGTDLDNIIVPGSYAVQSQADAAASALCHLPMHESGSLYVGLAQSNASIQTQRYVTNTKGIYTRRRFTGSWSIWRHFGPSRTDQTAGRAMYQWDELNAREQLVYGDTGLRNINDLSATRTAGNLIVARYGKTLIITVANLKISDSAGSVTFATLPVGFRPATDTYALDINTGTKRFYASPSGALMLLNHTDPNATYATTLNAMSNDTWPTTLPGTAIGTIPAN